MARSPRNRNHNHRAHLASSSIRPRVVVLAHCCCMRSTCCSVAGSVDCCDGLLGAGAAASAAGAAGGCERTGAVTCGKGRWGRCWGWRVAGSGGAGCGERSVWRLCAACARPLAVKAASLGGDGGEAMPTMRPANRPRSGDEPCSRFRSRAAGECVRRGDDDALAHLSRGVAIYELHLDRVLREDR